MRLAERLGLWWVPLLLALAPAAGLAPAHRDLVDFFAPMRATTAAMLRSGEPPWLNLANGCGEAWFANPETAVLYPPAWLHLVLPAPWALSLEIALHLAWLSLGVGLLARHLGVGPLGRRVAEAAAWSAGPVVFSVGVLNNLETLAWAPWMVLAARAEGARSVALVAGATALGWLGGEPNGDRGDGVRVGVKEDSGACRRVRRPHLVVCRRRWRLASFLLGLRQGETR